MTASEAGTRGTTLRARVRARARRATPEPLLERLRLLLARRLEARVRRSAATRGAALVLHAVEPRAGNRDHEIEPAMAVGELHAAVGYLARRYALVRAADMPAAARARRAGQPVPVAITFDDDLPSHREHAAPVLRRHGAVATAFLCATSEPFWWQLLQRAVDERAIAARALLPHVDPELVAAALKRRPAAIRRLAWAIEELAPAQRDRVRTVLGDALPEPPALLGPDGAAALAAEGWEIGFHTRRHDRLTSLDDDALRAALEPASESGARTLAYPHGKATAREADAARERGYVAAYTGAAAAFTERTDEHLIGRLQPDTATLGRFALQLARTLSTA